MTDTKWLTVEEASLLCDEMSLHRTKKTIRSWARNSHVASRKQTTANGAMWVLDKAELLAKVKAEKEFAEQQTEVRTVANEDEPVRTRSDRFEPVQTRANPYEQVQVGSQDTAEHEPQAQDQIRSLKTQIQALSVDVQWRDKMLDKLTRENARMLENMHGQARYIGHLESDLLRLGGEPDQQFLQAPRVQSKPPSEKANDTPQAGDQLVHSSRPHPDQQSFISG